MPEHIPGESREHWMARCVPVVIKEGKDKDAAVGQCEGMYDSYQKKSKAVTQNWAASFLDPNHTKVTPSG